MERDDPALDLRSIDITSDSRSLTAVLRVVRLSALPATAPLGGRWETSLRLSGTTQFLYLWAETAPGGSLRYLAGYSDATLGVRRELGLVTGSFDLKSSEVRITAPLDLFESVAPLAKGTWLEGIVGLTTRNTVGNRGDSTRPGAYRIGDRSCVR